MARFGILHWAAIALLVPSGVAFGQTDRLELSPGDALSFAIIGVPDLERITVIGFAGELSLPLVGQVSAAGLTVDELRSRVAGLLSLKSLRSIGLSGEDVWRRLTADDLILDVDAYRPIYVSGTVRQPGELPYLPGITVRQAIAKAGGVGLLGTEGVEAEVLRLAADQALLQVRMDIAQADLVRLEADLAALGTDGSPTLPYAVDEMESPLLDASERWLSARAVQRDLQDETTKMQLEQMRTRLGVLQKLEQSNAEGLKLEQDELERSLALTERGLVPSATLLEARRGLLQSSTRTLETSGEILRLQLDIARAGEETAIRQTDDRVETLARISKQTEVLETLEQELRSNATLLSLYGGRNSAFTGSDVTVFLFRTTPEGSEKHNDIELDHPLRPGDVLDVSVPLPDGRMPRR